MCLTLIIFTPCVAHFCNYSWVSNREFLFLYLTFVIMYSIISSTFPLIMLILPSLFCFLDFRRHVCFQWPCCELFMNLFVFDWFFIVPLAIDVIFLILFILIYHLTCHNSCIVLDQFFILFFKYYTPCYISQNVFEENFHNPIRNSSGCLYCNEQIS